MRRFALLVPILLFAGPAAVPALDLETRPVGPVRTWRAADLVRFDDEWIHLKLVEGSNAVIAGAAFADDAAAGVADVNAILAAAGVRTIRRTFAAHDRAGLRAKQVRAARASGVAAPDLSLWFDVRVPGGRVAVARGLNALNGSPVVEIAHPAAVPATAVPSARRSAARPVPRGTTPDFTSQQGYLSSPPVGLDAAAAWAEEGGLGPGLRFVDVELAWTEKHEDFAWDEHFFYAGGAAEDPMYLENGTAVLGEVIGAHNGFGISGFAPKADYGIVAITIDEWPSVPHRFQEAIDALNPGDVWLIELQMFDPVTAHAVPMEWLQVNWDVIFTGVFADGVVCVEVGANGSQDLDDPKWGGLFDRDVRDSGAILVAAGTPDGLVAETFSNWGSRMDAHGWGRQIVTTGWGDLHDGGSPETRYTADFGGTAGASAMVAGAALCLQGIAKARYGVPLPPTALRHLLTQTGTPPAGLRYVGPRPALGAAVHTLLNVTAAGSAEPRDLRVVVAPNPFRADATVRFAPPRGGPAFLAIHDVHGRRIRTLSRAAGEAPFRWDGRDDAGRAVAGGVYFWRLGTSDGERTGRVHRLR